MERDRRLNLLTAEIELRQLNNIGKRRINDKKTESKTEAIKKTEICNELNSKIETGNFLTMKFDERLENRKRMRE